MLGAFRLNMIVFSQVVLHCFTYALPKTGLLPCCRYGQQLMPLPQSIRVKDISKPSQVALVYKQGVRQGSVVVNRRAFAIGERMMCW